MFDDVYCTNNKIDLEGLVELSGDELFDEKGIFDCRSDKEIINSLKSNNKDKTPARDPLASNIKAASNVGSRQVEKKI